MIGLESSPRAAALPMRPVYFISDRPEAYEFWGEVSHDEAARIGRLIAERARRRFPAFDFRIDAGWHVHPSGSEEVTAFIEGHVAQWLAEATRPAARMASPRQ